MVAHILSEFASACCWKTLANNHLCMPYLLGALKTGTLTGLVLIWVASDL